MADWQAHVIVIPSSLPCLLVFPLPTLGSKSLIVGTTWLQVRLLFHSRDTLFFCLSPFQVMLGTQTSCVTHSRVPAKLRKEKGRDCEAWPREPDLCPRKGDSLASSQKSSWMSYSLVEFRFSFAFKCLGSLWELSFVELDISAINSLCSEARHQWVPLIASSRKSSQNLRDCNRRMIRKAAKKGCVEGFIAGVLMIYHLQGKFL